ncbi:MAG: hypothetical protein ABW166_15130 [Sedimenticola sp.]
MQPSTFREGRGFPSSSMRFLSMARLRGDNDVETANANMQTLGLKDKEGRLDMEIVKAFGIFAQEQYMLGSPDFELLQWHLHALYPDRVAEPEEGGEGVESQDANTGREVKQ